MTDWLEGECNTQSLGQTTHGRPNDESSAKSWKDSGSIGNDSSRLLGLGPNGRKIAQGYKTQGLKEWIAQGPREER